MSGITYKIKHVGISTDAPSEAAALCAELVRIFALPDTHDTPIASWGSDLFEVMYTHKRGAYGHIAMQTEDVEAAMADLASRGITFDESSIRRDENGKINFIYLNGEWHGFCFHLTT